MRKLIILAALAISVSVTYAQSFTESFDSVFVNISRADATTGILYERVIPFAQLQNFNSNIVPVDTSNHEHFRRAYRELNRAAFLPSAKLPFDRDSLKSIINENNDVIDIGILHYKFNTLDSLAARQKLYFGVDSVLFENTGIATSLYAEKTAFEIKNSINFKKTYQS